MKDICTTVEILAMLLAACYLASIGQAIFGGILLGAAVAFAALKD